MLLVETYIGTSQIHGIGLFAAQKIRKGTPIWEFNSNTTQVFWKKQFLSICNTLALPALLEFLNHSYIKEGNIYYLNDRTKYINHSLMPNVAFKSTKLEIAIKDINIGEEITENYLLSYDKNDFFFWDLELQSKNKETICAQLRERLLIKTRPKQGFIIDHCK